MNFVKCGKLLVFSLLTVPLRSYTSVNNPFNLDGDNGFPESNMVMKMIDKFREEKNLKNLNLYTNNSNAMSFHMQIWENNYPLKVCNTSVIKKDSFDAYKDDCSILYIDVGKNDGLKINDVVFNEKGLIGRIIEILLLV